MGEPLELESRESTWFEDRVLPLWEEHLLPLPRWHVYVEVGVWEGKSLAWAAQNLMADEGGTWAVGIDNYQPPRRMEYWQQRTSEAKIRAQRRLRDIEHATLMLGDSFDCLLSLFQLDLSPHTTRYVWVDDEDKQGWERAGHKGLKGKTDAVYIDGNHKAGGVLADLVLSWELLKPGGLLIIDDVDLHASRRRDQAPKVHEAMHSFLICHPEAQTLFATSTQHAYRRPM